MLIGKNFRKDINSKFFLYKSPGDITYIRHQNTTLENEARGTFH